MLVHSFIVQRLREGQCVAKFSPIFRAKTGCDRSPNHNHRPFSSGVPVFKTDFDDECKRLVKRRLVQSLVKLRRCKDFGGRGLFARRAIQRSEIVLREEPLIDVANPKQTQLIEDRFHDAIGTTQLYDDVPAHDDSGRSQISSFDSMVKGMLEMALESPMWPIRPSQLPMFRCLGFMTDINGMHHSTRNSSEMRRLFNVMTSTFRLDDCGDDIWSMDEFAKLRSKASTNALSGQQLYLAASLINHHCGNGANVAWHHQDPLRTIVAIRPIQEGGQIFFDYTGIESYEERREFLKEAFGFDCKCALCQRK